MQYTHSARLTVDDLNKIDRLLLAIVGCSGYPDTGSQICDIVSEIDTILRDKEA